jgi:hypothetical protein
MNHDPSKPLVMVLSTDPNLDLSEMDILEYLRSRDPALIRDKSEVAPATRFSFGPIAFDYLLRIDEAESTQVRQRQAFAAGLRSVTTPDGKAFPLHHITVKIGDATQQVLDGETLQAIKKRFGMDAIYELGRAHYRMQSAPDGDTDPLR